MPALLLDAMSCPEDDGNGQHKKRDRKCHKTICDHECEESAPTKPERAEDPWASFHAFLYGSAGQLSTHQATSCRARQRLEADAASSLEAQFDLIERVTKITSFAMSAPIMVPIAAQVESPRTAKAQKPNFEIDGLPTKTGAVTSTDRANGHIKRGFGRDAIAAPTQAANVTIAANGSTNITEKSTSDD